MKWEIKVVEIDMAPAMAAARSDHEIGHFTKLVVESLNKFGEEGWEPVGFFNPHHFGLASNYLHVIVKRRKEN